MIEWMQNIICVVNMAIKVIAFLKKFWPEIIAFVIFGVLSFVFQFFHEAWLDEAQAWNIGSTLSWRGIFGVMGYEGTPMLWHALIKIISYFGLNFFGFHIFHWLIIVVAVGLLLFFSPLSRWQKLLIPFGYFFLFEYNLIARSYALAILFLFLIAALYRYRQKYPYLFLSLLMLLSQTCIHATCIALVIFAFFIVEMWQKKMVDKRRLACLVLLFICNLLVIIFQVFPPLDAAKDLPWNTPMDLFLFFNSFIGAFVPISAVRTSFWGTQIMIDFFTQQAFSGFVSGYFSLYWLRVVFGLFLFFVSALFFIRRKFVLLQYLASIFVLELVYYLLNPGSIRHHGLIFIVFIFYWWIAQYTPENEPKKRLVGNRTLSFFIVFILCLQIIASAVAYYYEYFYDFSGEKKVAIFLEQNGYLTDKYQIVGFHANTATTLSAFLPKDQQVYCLEYSRFCNFNIWNEDYSRSLKWKVSDLVNRVLTLQRLNSEKKVVLVVYKKINSEEFKKYFKLIYSVEEVIMGDGRMFVYILTK